MAVLSVAGARHPRARDRPASGRCWCSAGGWCRSSRSASTRRSTPRGSSPSPSRGARCSSGLALAGLLGIPGVVTTAVASLSIGGRVVARRRPRWSPGSSAPCSRWPRASVGARATTSAASRARRAAGAFREVMAAVVVLPFIVVGPLLGRFFSGDDDHAVDASSRLADVLSWTPFGRRVGGPGRRRRRRLGARRRAASRSPSARWSSPRSCGTAALAHALVNPPHQRGVGPRPRPGLVRPAAGDAARRRHRALPRPTGRATRATRSRSRSCRCSPSCSRGVDPDGGAAAARRPDRGATCSGWGISADVAYDGTAFWTHVAAPLRGRRGPAGGASSPPARSRVPAVRGARRRLGRGHGPAGALIPALLGRQPRRAADRARRVERRLRARRLPRPEARREPVPDAGRVRRWRR